MSTSRELQISSEDNPVGIMSVVPPNDSLGVVVRVRVENRFEVA